MYMYIYIYIYTHIYIYIYIYICIYIHIYIESSILWDAFGNLESGYWGFQYFPTRHVNLTMFEYVKHTGGVVVVRDEIGTCVR